MKTAVLLLLAGCLVAADGSTTVHLPGGRRPLAEVIADIPGLRLAEGIDARNAIELPPIHGLWWDATLAVCKAYALHPDPGSLAGGLENGDNRTLGVGSGPVVLSAGAPPPASVCGPLLLSVEPVLVSRREGSATRRELSFQVRLRAEPALTREAIGLAGIAAPQLIWDGDRRVGLVADTAERWNGQAPAWSSWRATDLPAAPRRLRMEGRVAFSQAAAWRLGGATRSDQTHAQGEGAKRLAIAYFAKDLPGRWEGEVLPDQGPLIVVLGMPQQLGNDTQLVLKAGGTVMELRQVSSGMASDGRRWLRIWRPRGLPEGDLELTLSGRSALAPVETPFTVACEIGNADLPQADQNDQPSHLAWESGPCTLDAALTRLGATGNPVMLELGIDGTAAAELPALNGTFWQGVIAICKAWNLAPALPAADAMLGSGPVRLCQGTPPMASAIGPALAIATGPVIEERSGLSGRERVVESRLRILLEPRLDPERFSRLSVSWASLARDERGASHVVAAGAPAPSGNRRSSRRQAPTENPPPGLRLSLAPGPAPHLLTIAGMLWLGRGNRITGKADLDAGTSTTLDLGGCSVELHSALNGTALPGGTGGPGCMVLGASALSELALRLTAADGNEIPLRGGYENGEGRWHFPAPLAAGRLHAELTARRSEPDLVLPFDLCLRLPDGL